MNSEGRLKENEIFNEITNTSDEESSSSESESKKDINSLHKNKLLARNNVAKLERKRNETENKSNTENSKSRQMKESLQGEGKLSIKRKAQKDDSGVKPSKISCESPRSNSGPKSKKTPTPKRAVRNEDKSSSDDIYHPSQLYSPSKRSAKKNLFSPGKNLCEVSKNSTVRLTDRGTPSKQKEGHQNDKENRIHSSDDGNHPSKSHSPTKSSAKKNLFSPRKNACGDSKSLRIHITDCVTPTKQKKDIDEETYVLSSTKKKTGKHDTTPRKKFVRGNLSFEETSKIGSPNKDKHTSLKNPTQVAEQSDIVPHGNFERGSRTPRKNTGESMFLNSVKEISDELSPSFGSPSSSKNFTWSASKQNSNGKQNYSDRTTTTPQKHVTNSVTGRELKRLNIDCNPSFYEAPSQRRKSSLKTISPQKRKDFSDFVIKTPQKNPRKDIEKEIDSDDAECITPHKNKSHLSRAKDTSLSSAVKHEIHKQDVMSPLQRKDITVTTPVSKKKSGRGVLTPSMVKKEHANKRDKSDDDLDTTRKQLHISTVPKSLPCRDAEFDQIKSFLLRKIEHSAGGCMYISGVPGTGKTATVHAVIRSLQQEVDSGELPDFDFVEVNGLRLTEPKQAYVRILQTLTDKKLSPDQAQQLLNKRFSGNCKKSTIILVDELDYLCNRRQDVVYNILDWPTKRGSGLVVLTISNTMDLPERTLKGRVTSRMGLTRITFQPYSHHQLKTIVEDRLSGTDTFHPDAVQLVARKVAAVSGDARRALDICRRTTELVTHAEQVTVSHVERALTQIFSGPRVTVIQSMCREGQLVLRAIRDVNQRTGVDEATVVQVYKHLQEICLVDGCPRPTVGDMLLTCVSLVAMGLIVAEKGRADITRKMSLNVSSDDIHYALDNIRV